MRRTTILSHEQRIHYNLRHFIVKVKHFLEFGTLYCGLFIENS